MLAPAEKSIRKPAHKRYINNMRSYLFLFFFYFLLLVSYGQNNLVPKFDKAVTLMQSGNCLKAKDFFTEVYEKASDLELKKMSLIYRARCYNELYDYQSAIKDLDKAIEIDPRDLASYIDRGESKIFIHDYIEAKTDFRYVISKGKKDKFEQAALYYLSKIAIEEKDYDKTIYYITETIALTTDSKDLSELYFDRGYVKGVLKNIEASIFDYDNAIAVNSEYVEAYANRGTAKINLLTTKGNLNPTKEQTNDACSDLNKAYQMGDKSVKDLITTYCK